MYSMWATINDSEEVLAHMDQLASHWGPQHWRPGEWRESHGGLIRSGFMHEAGTYVMNPALIANDLVPSLTHKALNAGTAPFRYGVTGLRMASWHMAYHEARHGDKMVVGGKVGKFTEKDWGWVTERADMLAHNMSRASNAAIDNNPMFQTAFQFTTYFRRLAEITLGKRLTTPERMRLIAGNAIMYGVPITTTMTMLPFSDWMHKEAIDHLNYQQGKNAAADFFMNGLPTMLSIYALGYPLDFGERYGPKSPFSNLIGDETMWELGFGAIGTSAESLVHAFSPFMGAVLSTLPGSTQENRWPITGQDIWGVAREISTLNAAFEFQSIVRTGQWLTKRGRLVESDIPTWAGAIMALTGVRSLKQHEMYLKQQSMADDQKYEKAVLQNALEHYNKFVRAAEQQNYSEADAEFKKFESHYALMNPQTIFEAIKAGAKAGVDQLTQVDEAYFDPRRKPQGEGEQE